MKSWKERLAGAWQIVAFLFGVLFPAIFMFRALLFEHDLGAAAYFLGIFTVSVIAEKLQNITLAIKELGRVGGGES